MTTKFGWCLDGRHQQCKARLEFSVRFDKRVMTCGCSCHDEAESEPTYGD
ncbi:hypothetical protein [Aeromicrobium sp.]